MRVIVLADNIAHSDLMGEWGLSLYIEYEGKRFLLDTGASEMFISNARKLGVDISQVDYAVLSHAHYDHTGGLSAFLESNSKARVFLSSNARENCYAGLGCLSKYIGMPKDIVSRYPDRVVRTEGVFRIQEGVYLVPHSTEGLSRLGRRNHLYVRRGFRYFPDDFSHEHTLVFKTPDGLVLMNSCSHSGPKVIVEEVTKAFPDEHIVAYIGGLHLFRLNEKEVQSVSLELASCGIDRIYTGHCTGEKAFGILKERFAKRIELFRSGLQIDIPFAGPDL